MFGSSQRKFIAPRIFSLGFSAFLLVLAFEILLGDGPKGLEKARNGPFRVFSSWGVHIALGLFSLRLGWW